MKRLLAMTFFLVGCQGTEPATLVVSADSVVFSGFGSVPGPRDLALSSTGASVAWAASDDATWLSVTPTSGGTPASVVLLAHPDSLAGGPASATVTFLTNGSPAIPVAVRMDVPSTQATWTGIVASLGVSMTLIETSSGVISGTGVFISVQATPFNVTGTHHHPVVRMVMTAPGFMPVFFDGAFVGERQLAGVMNGSGFTGDAVSLDH